MKSLVIPEGYQSVMPYLIIKDGTAFINFMQIVFDAKEKMKVMRSETIVMHGEMQIGESTIMFADATESFAAQPSGMFVYVPNADETYNKALEAGATSIMKPCDQPYGRSSGVKDPFGNVWWITSPQ